MLFLLISDSQTKALYTIEELYNSHLNVYFVHFNDGGTNYKTKDKIR